MPKYKITEVDNTGSLSLNEQPNVVYIPGAATSSASGWTEAEPVLVKSAAALEALSEAPASGDTRNYTLTKDASYLIASRLLSLGMQVLYQPFKATSDAITITSDDWKALEDKNLYNVRFLTTGGYACPSADMIACATKRGDCVALVDHAKTLPDSQESGADNSYAGKVRRAMATFTSKYAAGFTPWFKADLGASALTEVPASAGYLFAFARSVQSNPLWKAAAGVFRGRVPELASVDYKYTTADCDKLQGRAEELDGEGDNGSFAINPICYRRYSGFAGGFNYVIYGNRTLLAPGDKGLQATSFLNVRALITELSKTLYDASITYTFEQNSDVLWINFKSLITPLLDKMQSGEGIAGYRLDRIATNKKARLCARVTIVPIEAVEDFELEIYLEDSLDASLEVRG